MITKGLSSRLFKNILSLSVLQLANFILPLITFPYLYRVLGVNSMGIYAISLSVLGYFQIFTDYGFNYVGTQSIARNKTNKEEIVEIYSSILYIKFFLILACLIILFFLSNLDFIKNNMLIYYLGFGSVIGQALFPIWFFQGLENMRLITILTLVAKGLSTVSIFYFVNSTNDLYLVPLINSLATLSIALYSLYYINRKYNVHYEKQEIEKIKKYLSESWTVFSTRVIVSLYTLSSPLIIGLIIGQGSVGYFNLADKIVKAIKNLYSPIEQSVFPYISNKLFVDKDNGFAFIKKVGFLTSLTMGIASVLVLLFSRELILFFGGHEFEMSILSLRIMSFLPFVTALGNVYSVQGLYNLGKANLVNRYILIISLFHVVYMFILTKNFGIVGGAISLIITELFVLGASLYYYYKSKK